MKKTISRARLHDVTVHPGFELAKHWHKQQKPDLAEMLAARSKQQPELLSMTRLTMQAWRMIDPSGCRARRSRWT